MKFQANSVEYWSKDQAETVFLGNEEKGLALVISNVPGTADHYLEWNDQSNACVNGVDTIQFSEEVLHVKLLPKAAEQLRETEFYVGFEADDALLKELLRCLKLIFPDKLQVKKTAVKQKAAPVKDYSKIRYLNLEGKNLKELPDYVSEMFALETVKLTRNPKLDLYAAFEVLANCSNLKDLTFSTESLVPENLGKLTQLESLQIYDLKKPCTFPESMGELKKLKNLLVMGDSDIVLPESFSSLTMLEGLNLRVESWPLPSKFYQLSKLKMLDFINCRFAQIPEAFAGMSAVETIVFGGPEARDFAQIMPVVARMPNLKTLELYSNTVPKEIALCKNIEKLVISTGLRTETPAQLPEELFELTKLQVLLLTFCKFDKIPKEIGNLKGLKSLIIKESIVESLPDSIGELSNLERLNLSEISSLKSLPSSLGKLTQLKELVLYENPQLMELPSGLESLENLTSIRFPNRETIKNIPQAWNGLFTEF